MEINNSNNTNKDCIDSNENNETTVHNLPADQAMEFDIRKNRWTYEDKDGNEYEYDEKRRIWVLSVHEDMDEELIRVQQNAYSVEGVDETIPTNIQKKNKKRTEERGKDEYLFSKKKNLGTPKNTAVYVSNLPPDVTEEEIKEKFSKCGLISENIDTGKPRIKIYTNERGEPKGDAVIVFFREESVKLAIQLLDDTYLRIGERHGQKIKVQEADTSYKKSQNNPVKRSFNEKRKLQQKMKKLNNKISEWDEDTSSSSGRWSKVVILKHMFTLKELEEDMTLIIDLKQDILEECSKIGNVTNIVLFDLEPDGVVSVRFSDEESALVCVKTMNGRYFGGKIVSAEIYDGKVRYRKSSNKNADDADEQARLEKFGEWLKSQE